MGLTWLTQAHLPLLHLWPLSRRSRKLLLLLLPRNLMMTPWTVACLTCSQLFTSRSPWPQYDGPPQTRPQTDLALVRQRQRQRQRKHGVFVVDKSSRNTAGSTPTATTS